MNDVLKVLAKIGGTGTTYAVARHICGRDRQHPESGDDWDFIGTQDLVRLQLLNAYRSGLVMRSAGAGRGFTRWIYTLLPEACGSPVGP